MKKYINLSIIASILFSFTFIACDEDGQIDNDNIRESISAPQITSFSPTSGSPGKEVTITGENFATVDSVYIGGKSVKVKNRISNSQLLIEVTPEAITGKIKVQNSKGTAESSNKFQVLVVVPSIGTITPPVLGQLTMGETVNMTGTDLKSVTKVLVGGVEAKLVYVSDTQIDFVVPTLTPESSVKVAIQYMNGTEETTIEDGNVFVAKKPTVSPVITSCPDTGFIGTTVTITGTNLDAGNNIKLGDKVINFASQTETEISFIIPMGYYVETTTNITLVYNGTEEMIAKADFVITVPVISDKIKYYYNITLGAEKTSTTPAQHFFNAENGMVYSACDYETIKNDVYFYVTTYTSGATIQFNNPNNSATQTSRFSCNGVPLTGEKLPNVVKFRKLTDSGSEGDFKQKVINRTLEEINPTIVTFSTGSSVMRQTDFNVGDVLLFRKSSGTEMVGFIEITDVNISSVLGESTITFNCFFQK